MSTPQDERPEHPEDGPEESEELDQVQHPMDDPQTRPAIDPDAEPPQVI